MVTDCLAPVIQRRGVGTLVTSDKTECLGQGLKYYYTENETYLTTPEDNYWHVEVYNNLLKYRTSRVTYLSADAMLLTPSGWRPVNKLYDSDQQVNVWGLKFRCVVCNSLHVPNRPILTVCSMECGRMARKGKVLAFKPVNEQSLSSVVEDWLVLVKIKHIKVPSGVEAVRLTKVENSDSIFINGLLLSSKTLQSAL